MQTNPTLRISEDTLKGFRRINVDNGKIAFTLLPELGAKIHSLRDLRSDHEWLWTSDRLPLGKHPYGVSYTKYADNGGWDECFPTVGACEYPLSPLEGTTLPDHGDVWSQPWETTTLHRNDAIEIVSRVLAVAVPVQFTRTLKLAASDAKVTFNYAATNSANHEVAFIWSAHPLFNIESGMRLRFPESARFNMYFAPEPTQLPETRGLRWPFTIKRGATPVSLDPLPGPDAGVAFKVWSDALHEGWAVLSGRNGELQLRFDPSELPQVALWLNAGGWTGIGGAPYYNLALEACIGAQDLLEEAVTRYHNFGILAPFETRRWSLTVALTAYK